MFGFNRLRFTVRTVHLRFGVQYCYLVYKVISKMSSPTEVLQEEQNRKIIVGICCMDVKGKSKPMQHIVTRLRAYPEFQIVSLKD